MKDKDTIIKYISNRTENEKFDIKRYYYHEKKKFDLIKDVVAFANSSSVDDKYVVFNIDNDTFQLCNMDMTTLPDISDINTLLHEYCEPNIDVELSKFNYNGGQVAYLKVCNSNLNFPYMIKKDFIFDGKVKLHQGQIYIRRGATNFIANRSDLDILVDMKVRRTIKIETQSLEQKQIIVDRQAMLMYSISFIFINAAKSNYLIKSAKINLGTSKNVFSIDVSFIANSNVLSFASQELLNTTFFDIAANSTAQKSVFFRITSECNEILMQSEDKIKATLILVDVNNNKIVSNTQLCSIENDCNERRS
ncbi:hypothetical protein M2102_000304 [Fusobacterium sp. PH5-7]|uniref:ATP-binding protein n=1 Tax=Fusobacterium sp. PH5-7 TaxID=2940528 RepID=UPI0024750E97|nr:ATP-binding protein [Fusobacterium sp. PH5-7]MDH6456691.1 hypothetical protein [Fusobacterium sp. PH5-7]